MMNELWNHITDGRLTERQHGQLNEYIDRLIEVNKSINLTRITDRAACEIKHVADALTLLNYLPAAKVGAEQQAGDQPAVGQPTAGQPTEKSGRKEQITLGDVGSGCGVPGVVLAIARPDIAVTLIDSTRKKLDAVDGICRAIGLTNVAVIHSRIEQLDERFDVLTTRGVADLATLLDWCERQVKRRGRLLALKGPKVVEELSRVSPVARRKWTIELHAVPFVELAGHQVVVATPRR